jgi:hypothetical protein
MIKYQLRLTYKNGSSDILEDVEEFVTGFRYLYVRSGSLTTSFYRKDLVGVDRRTNAKVDWIPVHLKKSKWNKDGE